MPARFKGDDAKIAVAGNGLAAAAHRVELEPAESLQIAGVGKFDHARELVAETLVRLGAEIRGLGQLAFAGSRLDRGALAERALLAGRLRLSRCIGVSFASRVSACFGCCFKHHVKPSFAFTISISLRS